VQPGRTPKSPWFYPSAGEYSTLLEKHGFEIRTAQTFERWTKLEHPDRGLREWLEMFAGSWFGRRLLDRMSDRIFLAIIEVLLVVMGLHSLLFPR